MSHLPQSESTANAAEFKSELGISFQYPDDWVAITDLNQADLPPKFQKLIQDKKFDLKKVKVVVLRDTAEEFAENFSVVIAPDQMPTTTSFISKLKNEMKNKAAARGLQIADLSAEPISIANRPAINMTFKNRPAGSNVMMQQRIVYVPGGGNTFLLTFTAPVTTYDSYAGAFETALQSLQVPPAIPGKEPGGIPPSLWQVLPSLAIGIYIVVSRRMKNRSAAKEPSPLSDEPQVQPLE